MRRATSHFIPMAVLPAIILSVSTATHASCGDYLASHESPAHGEDFEADRDPGDSSTTAKIPPLPCRGRECHRTPEQPALPLLPPVVVFSVHDGKLADEALPLQRVFSSLPAANETLRLSAGFLQRVERPPRVVADNQ